MNIKLQTLKMRLAEVVDLQRSAALLSWEQQTYMPPGGAKARAEQLATLQGLAHRLFITDEIGGLVKELSNSSEQWSYDSNEASLMRFVARQYERERKVPSELVAELASTTALAQEAWALARQNDDYSMFQPHLRRVIELTRQQAECFAPYSHLYDPLLDKYEPGMKTSEVQKMFTGIKDELIELVNKINSRTGAVKNEILYGDFDIDRQREFGLCIAKKFGYDLDRGRQDETLHPFCTHFSIDDVRITTRFDNRFLPSALFGTMHEVGHALYEQGISSELNRTGMDTGVSLGVHESQSRLWENLVGRSRSFWMYFFPKLQSVFPDEFGEVTQDEFYRAINRCEPSLIRVEADEVTYNLHIIIRFELELELLSGDLHLNDLPGAWREKYKNYLGVAPHNDADGVLQDIHWSIGAIGYFATYTIGNLLSVQLFDCVQTEIIDLEADISKGNFDSLLHWLRENIYCHGSKFTPVELVERVTGKSMDSRPYLNYLQNKYSDIYNL
jgi:carboxypeptidase Taq